MVWQIPRAGSRGSLPRRHSALDISLDEVADTSALSARLAITDPFWCREKVAGKARRGRLAVTAHPSY